MSKELYFKVKPRQKVKLNDYEADYDGGLDKQEAAELIGPLLTELSELQELLYGANTHSVLLVLQGRDTSGKDGAIKSVLGAVNPEGLKITSFKVPTAEEAAHDFLWRIHAATPGRGMIGIFNRSHYEEVLVVRVEKLIPDEALAGRYKLIENFETLLLASNTIVIKVYLHISKEEQAERLIDRQQDPLKAWKLSPGDWQVRAKWDDYSSAYEDALSRCSPKEAPWYVIPADRKWFRNLALARLLVESLRPYRKDWEKKLVDMQKKMLPLVLDAQKAEGE